MTENEQIAKILRDFCRKKFNNNISEFARALDISPQNLYKYTKDKDPFTVGPAMREKLRSVGLIINQENKIEYPTNEETEKMLLREENARLERELNEAQTQLNVLRKGLSKELINVLVAMVEEKAELKKSNKSEGTKKKRETTDQKK